MVARRFCPILAVALALGPTACQREGAPEREEALSEAATEAAAHVVDVAAVDYAFQAPAQIPSGWVTFRMKNEGQEPHFLVLWLLPEGRSFDDYRAEVVRPFVIAYDSLKAGAVDQAGMWEMLGRLLPEWFGSVQPLGGPGLVSPGGIARTTVHLEPGDYVMECYVKTPDGAFHSALGMIRPLTVTGEPSDGSPPETDVQLTLTNTDIAVDGQVTAGERTFAVRFEEHPAAGLGNDVHVARLEEGTDLSAVAAWMDWAELGGLRPPAPAEFLGGAHEMPVGQMAYFTVDLAPGRYAWLSEATAEERVVREFTVE